MSTGTRVVNVWTEKKMRAIMLHLQGFKSHEIGTQLGMKATTVRNYLNDPKLAEIIASYRKAIIAKLSETVALRLQRLGEMALEKIEQTLEADFMIGTKPKEHQDKMSLRVIEMLGIQLDTSAEVSDETIAALTEALARSNEVVDVSYEVLADVGN